MILQARWWAAVALLLCLPAQLSPAAEAKSEGTATLAPGVDSVVNGPPLAGTKPLTMQGDIASQLVEGVDKFLLRKIDDSVERRAEHFKRDFSSAEKYNASIEPNRKRLAHILGVRDPRVAFDAFELISRTSDSAEVAHAKGYKVFAIRWPVLDDPDPGRSTVTVYGEGLLLTPTAGQPIADIVALPDADQTPEQICGIANGVPTESQFARRLAESGCRVVVPVLISREQTRRRGPANLTHREFLYRPAFELGRHLIGYEVQKVLACVDLFEREAKAANPRIGVIGYGEGGMLALYAGALDTRIDAVCVSGYFENRHGIWQQPIDRNVFGLLTQFGDAELASMIAPRNLLVDLALGPQLTLPGQGGAPATLAGPSFLSAGMELSRAESIVKPLKDVAAFQFRAVSGVKELKDKERAPFGTSIATDELLSMLGAAGKHHPGELARGPGSTDVAARHQRQVEAIDRHNQLLLAESQWTRKAFIHDKLDTSSVAAYEKSVEPFRKIFYDDVIGRFDDQPLPPNVRTRLAYRGEKWQGYEVVLDVFPDVIAYGILLVPNDIKPGEKRPVVVCQHGLEGRPIDTIKPADQWAYKGFAARLAERGFITFAPQNLYIFEHRFRTLQRKANPLGKTLFSIIVPQHQQIVDWLKSLPMVDPQRIAFYGLSYGGKTAMRVPPLVKDYCISICSADFNEWVDKNASTRNPRSYACMGEYEIFEFDLGSTFNYAEMAALIAPRPFMVERGHGDGVADDWTVAWEFAKVRHLYAARLKLPERARIEWFAGPHTINGQETYAFLHKHLNWPAPTPSAERKPSLE